MKALFNLAGSIIAATALWTATNPFVELTRKRTDAPPLSQFDPAGHNRVTPIGPRRLVRQAVISQQPYRANGSMMW